VISEESEDEAINTEPYIKHCARLLYDFADNNSSSIVPLNFSADQNRSISLKYLTKAVVFPRIAQSCQEVEV
jgi:hypothetical protein